MEHAVQRAREFAEAAKEKARTIAGRAREKLDQVRDREFQETRVKTDQGELRYGDLRAQLQPAEAGEKPLDKERQLPDTPQQTWDRYAAAHPKKATEATKAVRQIQNHIDAGRYPERTAEEVIREVRVYDLERRIKFAGERNAGVEQRKLARFVHEERAEGGLDRARGMDRGRER
jgi:hypothetical protein